MGRDNFAKTKFDIEDETEGLQEDVRNNSVY